MLTLTQTNHISNSNLSIPILLATFKRNLVSSTFLEAGSLDLDSAGIQCSSNANTIADNYNCYVVSYNIKNSLQSYIILQLKSRLHNMDKKFT